MSPKGRPTDDPKTVMFRVRMSDKDLKHLKFCAQVTGMSKSDIVRLGVYEVYHRLKREGSDETLQK